MKPRALRPGDRVGLVAPSSPLYNRSELPRITRLLEELQLTVAFAPHLRSRHGYMAGTESERADDLNSMFADRELAGIICLQGGYGSSRLLPHLRAEPMLEHPKVFIGYSDITALHLALGALGLVTFYGPNASTLLSKDDSWTRERWQAALFRPEPLGELRAPADAWVETLVPGVAEGLLVGGCLSLVVASLGTPWEIDTRGRILYLEDVTEEPYRMDRMLTQLRQAGKFDDAVGVVMGECERCEPREFRPGFFSTLSLEDVLDEVVVAVGRPAIYGLPAGHGRRMATLPLGLACKLDAGMQTLTFAESATLA